MADPIPKPTSRDTPVTMRWVEPLVDGNRHWYLAALELDCQFWGYVHIRTNARSENRSFAGRLCKLKYQQVRDILDRIESNTDDGDGEPIEGALGLGTRAEFTTLIRFRTGAKRLPHSDAFCEIVSILQLECRVAADLITR